MITLLITFLLSIGAISTPADYDNLSTEQQEIYQQEVIILADIV